MRENTITGTSNRILEVDLERRSFDIITISLEDRKLYLGAKGLGLRLLHERLSPGIDPLSPENIIIFMPGVMMGTGFPCSNRFHAISKSPLTGIITTSSCGGPFGLHLKTGGWDGLILKGASAEPVWLEVTAEGIRFHDGHAYWGMNTGEFQRAMDLVGAGEVVIGPAGERLVRIANIRSGHRFLGRGGLGAVLGSKKVKAIIARGGSYKIVPSRPSLFQKTKDRALRYINSNEITSYLYRRYGTRANVLLNNNAEILPVRNFKRGSDHRAYKISGEEIRERFFVSPSPCAKCAIRCGQKGLFGGKMLQVPEYETTALLGSNLEIFAPEVIARWNHLAAELGLDTISLGNILGWYMEAGEKGLLPCEIGFGEERGIDRVIEDIGQGRGIGGELGRGVRYLSDKYGGKGFAMHIKGMEMPGYDPRGSFGQALSYAVANRGACHLSAFLVAMDVYFRFLNPKSAWAKARYVRFFESLTAVINSLQVCQFTMFAYVLESPLARYTPQVLLGLFMENFPILAIPLIDFGLYRDMWRAVTGIKISRGDFLRAGDRIVVLERVLNCREGISSSEDTLPPRIMEETEKNIPLQSMLKEYYHLRGYDEKGVPTPSTLKNLKIT